MSMYIALPEEQLMPEAEELAFIPGATMVPTETMQKFNEHNEAMNANLHLIDHEAPSEISRVMENQSENFTLT